MNQRLPALDGYRAISILLVLAGHLLPLGPKQWQINGAVAALGMTMFFSLSGFLIANQLLVNQDIGRFLLRRISRIWPLVLAYTFVVYIILHFDRAKMLFTNLFVVNYLTQYLDSENGHLWSLCVEVQFYLAIAVAVACGGRKAIWLVWPTCLLVTATRIWHGAEIDNMTHLRVDEILIGSCLATIQYYWSPWRYSQWLFAVIFVATLLASSPLMGPLQYSRPYFTAALFVVAANQRDGLLADALSSRVAKYIADVSYALYVIHPSTTHGWLEGIGTLDKYAIKRPMSFALTFALAHISTFYWERPWIKLARSATPRSVATT